MSTNEAQIRMNDLSEESVCDSHHDISAACTQPQTKNGDCLSNMSERESVCVCVCVCGRPLCSPESVAGPANSIHTNE